jgi:RNA-directed DNA polymerase
MESLDRIRPDEPAVGVNKEDTPVVSLMARVLERENLRQALKQVVRNKGAPGIDGMTVEQLPGYLKHHWPHLKDQLSNGRYYPQAVKRVTIPKPTGGQRHLGVPTVVDRFIQQALLQVLQQDWDASFSESSYGFRPQRSAHQAILQSRHYVREGYAWTVDIDLEKFFDSVNHDILMQRIKHRIDDRTVLTLIHRILKAEISINGQRQPNRAGTPQGGPLSPLLANLLLDELDKTLEARGHRFARYADDCNIYVKSKRAGERVLHNIKRYLCNTLKLTVNDAKSAVARPWRRSFLGFTMSPKDKRLKVSDKAINAFKQKVRRLSRRTRGRTIYTIIAELRKYIQGWKAYFQLTEITSPLRDIDKWLRRRLRSYHWKQWGRRGYRELRKRGVEVRLAWNTCKSAHGPWRLSKSPALYYALTNKHFAELGLPSVYQ